MEIKISKKDIVWSYIAQFLQMASGIILLPFILRMLSANEVGLNYIMLTLGSMVALLDFGFAPQLGRNISYVFGGADKLSKEGIVRSERIKINWRLLSSIISVSKKIYKIISFVALCIMLTIGTYYIYIITEKFTSVENVLLVWGLFSISVFYNLYVSFYNALLTGAGKIKESKYAIILSRVVYLIVGYALLKLGYGLMALSIAHLLQPVILAILAKKFFYTSEVKNNLKNNIPTKQEEKELFNIVWHNAKKIGINNLGAYGITKMGMFLSGLYLTLENVSAYGLMVQLVGAIASISLIVFNTYLPQIAAMRVSSDEEKVLKKFAFSIVIFYLLYISSCLILVTEGNTLLTLLGSSSRLPETLPLCLYCVVILLEQNHSANATLIVTGNSVPFVKAGLIAGLLITITSFISLKFTNLGIMGLVLAQGGCQLVYNNWKWPQVVLNDFGISLYRLIVLGILELKEIIIKKT